MKENLTPYKDNNGMYINYVQDSETKELRGITDTEAEIVDLCFSPEHHYGPACTELGYRNFERELFTSADLEQAAWEIYSHNMSSKRALFPNSRELLKKIELYLKELGRIPKS